MPVFKLKEIVSHFPECKFIGDDKCIVSSVISLQDAGHKKDPTAIAWLSDKNVDTVSKTVSLGLLILSSNAHKNFGKNKSNFLISKNPRQTFMKLLALKFAVKRKAKIEKSAVIASSSKLGKNCYIGNNVVIEENVVIGNNVEILHNTVIMAGTIIGNNVLIGCNCTIGNIGFGYEQDEKGNYSVLHHIGNVKIEDQVEIGNNTAIDRAVLGSTLIKKNAKIDNLVHIAHGVEIGENALIIANAMIAGSVKIGKNAWVAPSSSVLNKKNVGKNSVIGMGAVVIRDVEDEDVVAGNPARSLKKK